MTIDEIKELLGIFIESGVAEMELQRGENRLRLRRAGTNQEYVVTSGPAAASALPHPSAAVAAAMSSSTLAHTSAAAAPARALEPDANHTLVKSPIVGTFYEAAKPGDPPFVRVGDAVTPGQVLCIIESMKLMNEIEAEVSGILAARLVENGRPVEYGEALFAIRPRV